MACNLAAANVASDSGLRGARVRVSKWDLSVLSPSMHMCVCVRLYVACASAVMSMLSGSHRVMSMLSGSQCSLKRLKWQLSLRRLVQFKVAKVGWPCDSKLRICLLWSVSLGRPRPSFCLFSRPPRPKKLGGDVVRHFLA